MSSALRKLLHKSFRWLKKQAIIILSTDYLDKNYMAGDRRITPDRCPNCNVSRSASLCGREGPRRWYGECKVLRSIDTQIKCDQLKCNSCGMKWDFQYYYEGECPYIKLQVVK